VKPGGRIALYYGDELRRYSFGEDHPFAPGRLDSFWEEVCRRGLDFCVDVRAPSVAPRNLLESFHPAAYLDRLSRLSAVGEGILDGEDTPVFPGIYEAASAVVGTTVAACRALMAGDYAAAFIPIAGLHHGARDRASGFCAMNDCGVAIEVLKTDYGLERIAYVDIDLHHGDGLYYPFEADPAVYFADIHEDGRYVFPNTGWESERGKGAGVGKKLNIVMPPAAGDRDFFDAWQRVEAFVDAARPQFLLFQCGADGLAGEPLGHLRYTSRAHSHATARMKALAERHCPGRLLAMGGGGYNLRNVALAWSAVLEGLIGL